MRLGGSSGGVAGSNFPKDYAINTLSGTVEFNGVGAQTIPAFNYTNLTSNSTGARTLVSSGTIGISGSFTPGTNSYTVTGSTVDFNGTGAQTVPAFNFENLTVSGARTTNSVTFVNGGTIGIAATFTNSASFTTDGFISTNNTVDYNGGGAQSVVAITYGHLIFSNSGMKTISSSMTVQGNLTVSSGSSGTVDASVVLQINGNMDLTGSITNNGTINVGN